MKDGKKISRNSFLKFLGTVIGSIVVGCSEQTMQILEENTQTLEANSTVIHPLPDAIATFTPSPSPKSIKTVPIANTVTLEGITITEPINISDADFETITQQSRMPTIIEFWAPWCGPCKILGPMLDNIADEYAGRLIIARVNADQNPLFLEKFGVVGIPIMVFFSNGKVLHREAGVPSEEKLRDLVEKFLTVS